MRQCKRRLLIIGASGHGKVCADIAEKMNLWDEIFFADDNPPAEFPYQIIGGSDVEWDGDCFIGIGSSAIREKLSKGRNIVTLIHPNAVIGDRINIGLGTVVMAGAVINADAEIGNNVIINTCASVDHDSQIGDFVHVSVGAHLCGSVCVGRHTWIGAGATVKNNVNICGGCMIGAGAVVIKDISESGTYVGVPAKKAELVTMDKKILILANSAIGLHDFRKELIAALVAENEVVASTPFDDDKKVALLRETGCKLIDTEMERRGMNPLRDISLLKRYQKLLNTEKPDLVITYTIKPNIYGSAVCCMKKIPYAVNITGLGTAFEGQGVLRKMVTAMYKFALKKAKVVFFENAGNMQMFIDEKIIRKEQAKILNGAGVNLERYRVLPYPDDTEETRFLFMGRVMAEKGVDELFEVMRMLRKDGVNCSLDMLGGFDENYSEKIKEAEAEGWLRYHGYQSDVRPFIERCHCFVLPSWHEGMANTNLECAASGRPVITSNIHGCLEAVEDGVSGYLCDVKNSRSLFDAMKRVTELSVTERRAMGLAGRKRMKDVFDKKNVVGETIESL